MSDRLDHLVVYGQGVIGSIYQWGRDIREGYYVCENPERPVDEFTIWHFDCRGCLVGAQALQMRHPDNANARWLVDRLLLGPWAH